MEKAQAPVSAREARSQRSQALAARLAARMELKYTKKERARQNKLARARRSAEAQERAKAKAEKRKDLDLRKNSPPYELVLELETLLAMAKQRETLLRADAQSAHSLAHPDDPDSVQAWEGAKTTAQKAHKEYESLRVSLAYRKRQLAKFVVESEDRRALLRAELNKA